MCSPDAAKGFSAVPYIFARFLHLYLRVPVGIIVNALGQLDAELDKLPEGKR